MDKGQKTLGDSLAHDLVKQYWKDFTTGSTWNYYIIPLKYLPSDTWATREQWIKVAKDFIEKETHVLAGLEILLGEGQFEYLPLALDIVKKWDEEVEEAEVCEPEYYYDIIKFFPLENIYRRKYFGAGDFDWLGEWGRAALVSVEDVAACKFVAGKINAIFHSENLDEELVENEALPLMVELGRFCNKFLDEKVLDSAKQFCEGFLSKDREIAPYFNEIEKGKMPELANDRWIWICDDIAKIAWSIGWFDILEKLGNESWYWTRIFSSRYSDLYNESLLIWSQYLSNDVLRSRAIHVMQTSEYHKLDGAIAWFRMNNAKWPPN